MEKIEKGLWYKTLNGNSCFFDTPDGQNIMVCLPEDKSVSTIYRAKELIKELKEEIDEK